MIRHQQQRVGEACVGLDGHRIDHHPGLELLDLAHLVGLLGDRHVAVNDADPAGLRHRDRERAFGHGVHRRRDQRDAELDLAGEPGAGIGVGGQDRGGGRHQHDVVEGQRLPDFHLRSPCTMAAHYTLGCRRNSIAARDGAREPGSCAPAKTLARRHRSRPIRRGWPAAWRGAARQSRASRPCSRFAFAPALLKPWRRSCRPGQDCRGEVKAASARATMRRWSVAAWPVAAAAMSHSTTSAGPPSASLIAAAAPASRKSSAQQPGTGERRRVARRSTPTTPIPRRHRRATSATCVQPPGAQPKIDDALARACNRRKRSSSSTA